MCDHVVLKRTKRPRKWGQELTSFAQVPSLLYLNGYDAIENSEGAWEDVSKRSAMKAKRN
jgi:hypothetical protein